MVRIGWKNSQAAPSRGLWRQLDLRPSSPDAVSEQRMSEPSQGQRSAADGHIHVRAQMPATGNGAVRSANGAARRPVESHPVDGLDLFTGLAAACVPAFCDGLQFDLTADGASGVRASFPPGPDGAAPTDGSAADVPSVNGNGSDGGHHAEQLISPGRIVIAVHTELAAHEAPVVGTITCTWDDHTRPTEADALMARLLADQAAAKVRLASLGAALQKQLTRAANLEEALATNREIGQAIGILMATDHVTAEQAFEQLRTASQHTHRKLREIAADVAETGALTLPPELVRAQVKDGPTSDGRPGRRTQTTPRVQRRTRGGQPLAATPDGA
jgi:hypothetical protein